MPLTRPYWIFDLDGTLIRAKHDFDAIRRELGLPEGQPILEALDELPTGVAQEKHRRLDEIEIEIAKRATIEVGVQSLLEKLAARACRLGILTRNTRANAWSSLEATGLSRFFPYEDVLGRDEAPPKPRPDGIIKLLRGWSAQAEQAVMVGDFRFDLEAGRRAGVVTVYVDPSGDFPFRDQADFTVKGLDEL